jgi:membrane associated rhomboid family serine protease
LTVVAVFRGQLQHPEWTEAGALDATAVFERGEWWRCLTALFLHADEEHLVSNLLGGVLVFAAVLSIVGRVRGWLLLGLAAVSSNLALAAAHYPGPYRSLGASTAIFAALGLLTGRAVRVAADAHHPHRWRSFFIPAAAGLIVLALYGAGAPPVDVLAHVTGFVVGVISGFVWGAGNPAGLKPGPQLGRV